MTPQERHEDVMRRYPDGLTPAQFRHETLASADADGKLDPPALANPWHRTSLLIGMYMEGLIEQRGPEKRAYERSGPYYLTEAGRRAVGVTAASAPNAALLAEAVQFLTDLTEKDGGLPPIQQTATVVVLHALAALGVTACVAAEPAGGRCSRPRGVVAAPAHSKSEYKRRVAQGDPSVLPPAGGVEGRTK